MDSLVNMDLKPVAETANKLIDTASSAVSWIATHDTPKRHAINTYIEEIEKSDYSPLEKAIRIRNAKRIIKEAENQEAVVKLAIQEISPSAKPEDMDDDWVAQFMDKTRLVSDEDFQRIWAKVLAREANKPGTVPRALLSTLEWMDKRDAINFTKICGTCICVEGEKAPIIVLNGLQAYERWGINFDTLHECDALGLLKIGMSEKRGYSITPNRIPARIEYFDCYREITEKQPIAFGDVLLTRAGRILCDIIKVEKLDGFWEIYSQWFWGEGNTQK